MFIEEINIQKTLKHIREWLTYIELSVCKSPYMLKFVCTGKECGPQKERRNILISQFWNIFV